jgi:hypothetical protein
MSRPLCCVAPDARKVVYEREPALALALTAALALSEAALRLLTGTSILLTGVQQQPLAAAR